MLFISSNTADPKREGNRAPQEPQPAPVESAEAWKQLVGIERKIQVW
jgi:hypothetical protein